LSKIVLSDLTKADSKRAVASKAKPATDARKAEKTKTADKEKRPAVFASGLMPKSLNILILTNGLSTIRGAGLPTKEQIIIIVVSLWQFCLLCKMMTFPMMTTARIYGNKLQTAMQENNITASPKRFKNKKILLEVIVRNKRAAGNTATVDVRCDSSPVSNC
jgi:hypothetical protein